MRLQRLDEKDKQIISVLVKNPEASQSYIATKVNLSQPAVGARLQRLKESGNIAHFVGMDIKKVGFHLAKVEIAANNIENVLGRLKSCPHFLNGLVVSGKQNLCMLLIGEDISTLEALVEHHVRTDPEVHDAVFNVVTNTSSNFIIPITLSFEKGDIPPCGRECQCGTCSSYESGRCTGCPASEFYRGTFWS
jgi:DNA-binding Lrp family transcriptional regulator